MRLPQGPDSVSGGLVLDEPLRALDSFLSVRRLYSGLFEYSLDIFRKRRASKATQAFDYVRILGILRQRRLDEPFPPGEAAWLRPGE